MFHPRQRMETIVSELGGVDPALVQEHAQHTLDTQQRQTDAAIGADLKSCQSRSKVMVTL